MRINKNYDIAKLAEELRKEINDAKKPPYNGTVKLDIVIANNILDVLEETQRREQKHQTLESALMFIEKEDGTQTNLMELTNSKKTKTNLLEENKQTCPFSCFGNYGEEDEWEDDCEECMYAIECKELYEQRGEKKDE